MLAAILGLVIIGAIVAMERGLWRSASVAWLMTEAYRLAPNLAAVMIFAVTYFAVGIGHLPGFRIDRSGAAFMGAGLMVAFGILSLSDAYKAIDFDTITLLLGVMVVVANLRLSGFFRYASRGMLKRAQRPMTLLIAVVMLTGILSAFFVNDAICLAVTPLVLDLVIQTKRNPVPYLLAIAMSSNVGSTATITGNPQNMIIGAVSHVSYGRFAAVLSPIAAIGLILTVLVIALAYRSEFWTGERLIDHLPAAHASKPLMIKSVLISLAMVMAFFFGVVPARAAISAGAVMLLTRRIKSEKVYREVDWTLLLMFVGLFIVVAGLEKNLLTPELIGAIGRLHLESVTVLTVVTAVLSNLVSNVPAVLVLKPFVEPLRNQQHAWLTIAMASTLAGNFTLIGSVANLIVVQSARTRGVTIRFWDYFKVGAPLTVMTVAMGILRL
jgi:Na+/H+ antiporter NhaD/arsenite permease-like protein